MNVVALVVFVVWFFLIFVVRSIVQKRATGDSGICAGAFDASASALERFAYALLLLAFAGGLAAPITAMNGYQPFWDVAVVRYAGLAVAVASIAATYGAQIGMGTEWRIGIDKSETTSLITGGVFGLVRNPIFTAMIATAAGLFAMVPNILAAVAVVALIVAIELQVRYVEEPYLRGLHGSTYADYVARVGRFVPCIGRARGSRA